ncbi:MAG: ROK family protein, partial [Patescibacteria group bacterium]
MYLLFDIGGTKTRLAVSPDGKAFSDPKIIDTPSDFEEGMELLRKTCKELCKDKKLQAIAGGIRGTLDRKKEKLIQEHKLTQWVGKPIKSRLSVELGAPVYLETDTAMVGLGEAVSGAGRGFDIVAYITVSTGVGGARIVEKKIDENVFGFSPGHQIIDADGTICPECKALEDDASLGHLEAHISGTAVEKRFGKKPYEITDEKFWDEL